MKILKSKFYFFRFNVEDAVLDLLNHPNIELNNLTVKVFIIVIIIKIILNIGAIKRSFGLMFKRAYSPNELKFVKKNFNFLTYQYNILTYQFLRFLTQNNKF